MNIECMESTLQAVAKKVVSEFSNAKTIESYRKAVDIGLWASEKKLIEKHFTLKSTVLDVGCGTGRTTIELFKAGYAVVGIDITPAMIDAAKQIAHERGLEIDYRIGDATKLDFPNEFFDSALFSFNGWSQIPGHEQRMRALQEIYRVLKPGGYFIFTAHIRKFPGPKNRWLFDWFTYRLLKPFGYKTEGLDFGDIFFARDSTTQYSEKQYIHIASERDVKRQLQKTGFHLVHSEYRNTIAPEDEKFESNNCKFFVCRK